MNISSIESLYATIGQQQRVIKQAHEDIRKLTAERDNLIDAQAKSLRTIVKLTAERDELEKQLAKNNPILEEAADYIDALEAKVAELEDIANDYKQQISDQAIEIDDNQNYMKAQQSLISDQKNAIQELEAERDELKAMLESEVIDLRRDVEHWQNCNDAKINLISRLTRERTDLLEALQNIVGLFSSDWRSGDHLRRQEAIKSGITAINKVLK